MQKSHPPLALIILDGWGAAHKWKGNAISQAKLRWLPQLKKRASYAVLAASGREVGLPQSLAGNSEAGHLNIGAGRVVEQDISVINRELAKPSFDQNPQMQLVINHLKNEPNRRLHLIGLLSDGGVHSHIDHLVSLLTVLKRNQIANVLIHIIADGRDAEPKALLSYVERLKRRLNGYKAAKIASVIGRFYAMDRDKHEDRTGQALKLYLHGQGESITDLAYWVKSQYDANVTDEMLPPGYMLPPEEMTIRPNDAIIFWNYRLDRAKQLLEGLITESPVASPITALPKPLLIATFITNPQNLPVLTLFHSVSIKNPLVEVLSQAGCTQLHIAETEKYAHVSYFFNGRSDETWSGEDRILIDSGNFTSFTDKTEMRAAQIAAAVIDTLEEKKKYDFIVTNFANADMVAHTADILATIKAVEVLDRVLGIFVPRLEKEGYTVMITADHGNAEEMLTLLTNKPDPSHTTNPVPFFLLAHPPRPLRRGGRLTDIAPTILELMGIPQPPEMTGTSLLQE